ncbi:MAG: TolC family protein [Elusimicrobia bacterium]|nr:TolC family protein [Elusimicrobiota bacterium]
MGTRRILLCAGLVLPCAGLPVLAQEPVSVSTLTLTEAVRGALARSPAVAGARLNVEAAGLEEPLLLSNTDPRFQAAYSWTDDQSPREVPAFQGTRSRRETFQAGVVQNTLIGTEAKLSWSNEYLRQPAQFRALDPSAGSRIVLEIRQPILRYFWGRPDKARRGQARAGVQSALAQAHRAETETAAAASRAYLEYSFAHESVAIAWEGVEAARRLVNSYAEKRRYGLVEDSDLLQAQVSLEVQQTEFTIALSQKEQAFTTLLTSLALAQPGSPGSFSMAPPEEIGLIPGDLDGALSLGLRRRGDVLAAQTAAEAARWAVKISVLDTLPDLALSGSYASAALARNYADAWEDLPGLDGPVKSAGLTFMVPFRFERERLTRNAGRIQLARAEQELAQAVQTAVGEIRKAWEILQLSRARLDARRKLVELEEKKLRAEEADFRRGRSSTDLLVRFQQDLQRARQQFLRARTEEALARVDVGRATGTLLDALGVQQ